MDIFKQHHKALNALTNDDFVPVREWICEQVEVAKKHLIASKEPDLMQIGRYQGTIIALQKLLDLHTELERYDKDLKSGKARKIE